MCALNCFLYDYVSRTGQESNAVLFTAPFIFPQMGVDDDVTFPVL